MILLALIRFFSILQQKALEADQAAMEQSAFNPSVFNPPSSPVTVAELRSTSPARVPMPPSENSLDGFFNQPSFQQQCNEVGNVLGLKRALDSAQFVGRTNNPQTVISPSKEGSAGRALKRSKTLP